MKKLTILFMAMGMLNSQMEAQVDVTKIKAKFPIEKGGVYKLSYDKLIEAGVEDPKNVQLYGNVGHSLNTFNRNPAGSMLKPISVSVEKGSDQEFGSGDYLLFYAQGTSDISYNIKDSLFHLNPNPYSKHNYIYVTENEGQGALHIHKQENTNDEVTHEVNTSVEVIQHEKELLNPGKTGTQWFGELLDRQNKTFNLGIFCPDAMENEKARIKLGLAVNDSTNGNVEASVNNQSFSWMYKAIHTSYKKARYMVRKVTALPDHKKIDISLKLSNYNDISQLLIDKVVLNYERELVFNGSEFAFRNLDCVGEDNISRFSMKGASGTMKVWDISQPLTPIEMVTKTEGSDLTFLTSTTTLKEFVAFVPDKATLLTEFETVEINDLEQIPYADMLIIAHPELLSAARDLAEFHKQKGDVSCAVINVFDVYHNYSSGKPDPSGIYNFVRHRFHKTGMEYLLLMGAPSYDYRNLMNENHCFLPNYQNEESLTLTSALSTDDYYGILTDTTLYNGTLDIALGRIPASSLSEAQNYVEKIKTYHSKKAMGTWKNNACFIADDEDGQIHLKQADITAEFVSEKHPELNLSKIYLAKYPQLNDSLLNSGVYQYFYSYPEAETAIAQAFKKGQLFINFVGHGNPGLMTHEEVFKVENYKDISNQENLPFLTAFACHFSVIDNPEQKNDGSDLLFFNSGGVIGMVSAARLNYSGGNFILGKNFYNQLGDASISLGNAVKLAKNNTGTQFNSKQFYLLADPSIKLNWPNYRVVTQQVNGHEVGAVLDTLKHDGSIDFSGYIADAEGTMKTDFNGNMNVKLFNYSVNDSTITNEGFETEYFSNQGFLIDEQTVNVTDGQFSVMFDFSQSKYTIDDFHGKLGFYAYSDTEDAAGQFEQFIVKDFVMGNKEAKVIPKMKVFPNPMNNRVTFMLPETGNYQLLLTDVTGKVVSVLKANNSNKIVIQNQDLSKGVYFYQVAGNAGQRYQGKVIKQ